MASANIGALDALKALHLELVAVSEHRFDGLETLDAALQDHALKFRRLIDKTPRTTVSRTAVQSGEWGAGSRS